MSANEDESVLSRWSRRKLEAEQEAVNVASAPEAGVSPLEPVAEEIEAPPLTDADMPDIESLTEDSDFSGFMSSGVSDELRNLALRKLFHAPVFNIRDGLDEYDEDYTTFEKLGDIVTCDMKHQVEMQEQKLREALEAENEVGDESALEESALEDVEAIEDEDAGVIATGDDVNRPGQTVAAADDGKPAARADDE
ncbi:MAG: DUF3306 domain-containing protein [Gammaproteobacteria bacterium]|nr:DUF3306 domain-containing protein [Gammaproteobacteria bacterium]